MTKHRPLKQISFSSGKFGQWWVRNCKEKMFTEQWQCSFYTRSSYSPNFYSGQWCMITNDAMVHNNKRLTYALCIFMLISAESIMKHLWVGVLFSSIRYPGATAYIFNCSESPCYSTTSLCWKESHVVLSSLDFCSYLKLWNEKLMNTVKWIFKLYEEWCQSEFMLLAMTLLSDKQYPLVPKSVSMFSKLQFIHFVHDLPTSFKKYKQRQKYMWLNSSKVHHKHHLTIFNCCH